MYCHTNIYTPKKPSSRHISFSSIPEGEYGYFFRKNKDSQNHLKPVAIDPVFYADSEYRIGFDIGLNFLGEKWFQSRQKCTKMVPPAQYYQKLTRWSYFLECRTYTVL